MVVATGEGGAKSGAANARVNAMERSASDYHVSGEGLPWNWMDVLSHGVYNI
jgi:hypothetical protein